ESDFMPSAFNFPVMMAATGAAPAGSTTIFDRSSKNTMAAAISSSDTVTTSSQYSWMMSKGTSPGRPTALPSAMVATLSSETGLPATNGGGYAAAFSACTPITLI